MLTARSTLVKRQISNMGVRHAGALLKTGALQRAVFNGASWSRIAIVKRVRHQERATAIAAQLAWT